MQILYEGYIDTIDDDFFDIEVRLWVELRGHEAGYNKHQGLSALDICGEKDKSNIIK